MKQMKYVVVVVILLVANLGFSTVIIPKTAQDLSQGAAVIFVGTCVSRDVKAGPPVSSDYSFSVDTPVKGGLQINSTFKFHQWGGPSASKNQWGGRIATLPVYEPGLRYLLFLGPSDANGFRLPVGGGQGVFKVQETDGEGVIAQDALGGRWLFPAGSSQGISLGKSAGGASSNSLQLDEFLQSVRKMGGQ